jgi:hypothetical protein
MTDEEFLWYGAPTGGLNIPLDHLNATLVAVEQHPDVKGDSNTLLVIIAHEELKKDHFIKYEGQHFYTKSYDRETGIVVLQTEVLKLGDGLLKQMEKGNQIHYDSNLNQIDGTPVIHADIVFEKSDNEPFIAIYKGTCPPKGADVCVYRTRLLESIMPGAPTVEVPAHRNCEVIYNDPEERIVVLKDSFHFTKMMMGGAVHVKDPMKTAIFINPMPKLII